MNTAHAELQPSCPTDYVTRARVRGARIVTALRRGEWVQITYRPGDPCVSMPASVGDVVVVCVGPRARILASSLALHVPSQDWRIPWHAITKWAVLSPRARAVLGGGGQ